MAPCDAAAQPRRTLNRENYLVMQFVFFNLILFYFKINAALVKLAVGTSWTAQLASLLRDPEWALSPAPRTAIRPRMCALPAGAGGHSPQDTVRTEGRYGHGRHRLRASFY